MFFLLFHTFFFFTFWGSRFEFPKSQVFLFPFEKIDRSVILKNWLGVGYILSIDLVFWIWIDMKAYPILNSLGASHNKEVFKTRASLKGRWVKGYCYFTSCDHSNQPSWSPELLAGPVDVRITRWTISLLSSKSYPVWKLMRYISADALTLPVFQLFGPAGHK